MNLKIAKVCATLASAILLNIPLNIASATTISYESSSASFPNPEKGFYTHYETFASNYSPLNQSVLETERVNNNVTLILRLFYLDSFVTGSAISESFLTAMQSDFNVMRQAGVKSVVRFAYSNNPTGVWPPAGPFDAPPAAVVSHIQQLAPYLQNNADVIAVVQSGFIGTWGEGFYTNNFTTSGNLDNPNTTDWANRNAVVDALLNALPQSRMVQLRTPNVKYNLSGTTVAISENEAFSGSKKARLGHHNDCLLSSTDGLDYGTYRNLEVDVPYLEQESKYVPVGGETCSNIPLSDCSNAQATLARFHYSYINKGYHPDVISKWQANGCYNQIDKYLGPRYRLVSSDMPDSVTQNSSITVTLAMNNDGYASNFNSRPIELVLRNIADGLNYKVAFNNGNADPKFWLPGAFTVNSQMTIPSSVPVGTYELLLNMPDQSAAISSRPEYSIQLANSGLWEASTGFNKLNHQFIITAEDNGDDDGSSPVGPADYITCATENGTCTFAGVASVAYGANGSFYYLDATDTIACDNSTFGDPISGVEKACYYQLTDGSPAGYIACAGENGICTFSGAASVAYGADGSFNYLNATNSIVCNNITFGDPLPGIVKTCYYQLTESVENSCSGVAQYVDGNTYNAGDVVQNAGYSYQCNVAGWCTVGGPYEPGNGWAWSDAWTQTGSCL